MIDKKKDTRNRIILMLITIAIVTFVLVSLYMIGKDSNEDNETNNYNNIVNNTINDVKKNLKTGQKLDKYELLDEKYNLYIIDTDKKHICAANAKKLATDLRFTKNINDLHYSCVEGNNTTLQIVINSVSDLQKNEIESNTKYYNSNNELLNTSIDQLNNEYNIEFKNSCKQLNYKEVLRNPDEYANVDAFWFGKIVQVIDKSSSSSTFRISVTCEKLKYSGDYLCDDTMYVIYEGDKSFIEDDMVKMWGYMNGTETYTTVLGSRLTIPRFRAKIMELN